MLYRAHLALAAFELTILVAIGLVWFMAFNATFNSISVVSWRSVLLMEKTRVLGENHRPAANHWQTLSHNVVSGTPRLSGIKLVKEIIEDVRNKPPPQKKKICRCFNDEYGTILLYFYYWKYNFFLADSRFENYIFSSRKVTIATYLGHMHVNIELRLNRKIQWYIFHSECLLDNYLNDLQAFRQLYMCFPFSMSMHIIYVLIQAKINESGPVILYDPKVFSEQVDWGQNFLLWKKVHRATPTLCRH